LIKIKALNFRLILFIILLASSAKFYAQCPNDRDALIALYNDTDGANWTNNANWNTAAPLNTWYGVTTDAQGCVTNLRLFQNNLVGTIPPELGDLSNIQELNFHFNQLSGTIPAELGNLTLLVSMTLSLNQLTGIIPPELGNLANLEQLNLFANQLNGSIPPELGNLASLRSLFINNNQLTGTIPGTFANLDALLSLSMYENQLSGNIPPQLGDLDSIETINLSDNQFTGPIPPELGSLSTLLSLSLSNNQLTGIIPTELGNLLNLNSLSLGFNQLTGTIPATIGNIIDLESMNISSNQITGSFPPEFGNLVNLRLIFAANNQMNGNIPDYFSNMSLLEALLIQGNQFSGNLPLALGNLPDLRILGIQNNQFEGTLPDFSNSSIMELLRINNNRFQFGDFENEHPTYTGLPIYANNPQARINSEITINAVIGNNTTLNVTCSGNQNTYQWYKGVYPSGTLLAGETNSTLNFPAVQIADAGDYYCVVNSNIVTNLTLVREPIHLNVDTCDVVDRASLIALYNATDGPNWANNTNWNTAAPLDTWFGITTNGNGCVIGIDLNPTDDIAGSNNLSGTLPEELGDLQSLIWLDLAVGNLTGPIPASITTLADLQFLNIFSHDLTGEIPNNIGDLTELRTLQLSQNALTGVIPNSVTTLSNLRNLQLRINDLSGIVPLDVTNMIELRILQLGGNNFTGFIYPEYGNLVNLIFLELEGNQLTGIIPTELGNLINMRDLRLGSQDLTGTLPASLSNMANIDLISIRNTLITGPIPPEYGNLDTLRFLILNSNDLTGMIPPELGNISSLFQLGLSNNQLTGNIPATLLNCLNLSGLAIGNNDLEGIIPDFTTLPNMRSLSFGNNNFQFGDFENQHIIYTSFPNGYINNPQAEVDLEETLNPCENQSVTFTTTVSGSQNTYQWFKDGIIIPGETNATLTFANVLATDSGVYHCEINSNIVTDLTLIRRPITLNVTNNAIVANPVNNITACDNNNDGFANFTIDITDIENQVLGAQTGLPVSFLDDLGNPLTLTNPFTNTIANTQTITVVVGDLTGCFAQTTFDLIALPAPNVPNLTNETRCDSYTLPVIASGNYYTGPNGTGTQLNAGDAITTSQTLFIYQEIGTAPNICSDESNFTVTINETSVVDIIADQVACDSFILPTLTFGNYFLGPNGTGMPLNAGDTITTSQTVYIFSETGTNPNCTDQSSFIVTINTTPTVDTLANETACDSFTLLPIANGNYFTGTNGTGTQLNAGDVITLSQTIYVYEETGTTPNCFDETSFMVTINTTPSADILTNQVACDSFTLPTLTTGNYFTGANGTGTQLNAGATITTSQTIYIYAETATNPNCSDESSFTVTINTTPTIDSINDVQICESYQLPILTNGTYYTGANGTGTQLNSGDTILNSQTIYIYSESGTAPNCSAENSFEVTINPETDFSLTDANLDIDEQNVIVNMTDLSIEYEYAIDSGNFQSSNEFFNLTEGIHTLTVRDENGCVEKFIDFEIVITKFNIPAYFTPNSDGYHDTWQIEDTENTIKSIQIFDRYGKLLKQIGPQSSWDGTYRGKLLPVNDYWYVVTLNSNKQLKGHFTLKR